MGLLELILVVLIVVALFSWPGVGALPGWPYASGWGYGPFGIILLILLVLLLVRFIH